MHFIILLFLSMTFYHFGYEWVLMNKVKFRKNELLFGFFAQIKDRKTAVHDNVILTFYDQKQKSFSEDILK